MKKKQRYVELKYYENGLMQIKVPKVIGNVPGFIQYPVAVAILMRQKDKDFEKLVWKKWDKLVKAVQLEKKHGKEKSSN